MVPIIKWEQINLFLNNFETSNYNNLISISSQKIFKAKTFALIANEKTELLFKNGTITTQDFQIYKDGNYKVGTVKVRIAEQKAKVVPSYQTGGVNIQSNESFIRDKELLLKTNPNRKETDSQDVNAAFATLLPFQYDAEAPK
jgi:hypothetical protein